MTKIILIFLSAIFLAAPLSTAQHRHHHRSRPVKADVSVKNISKKNIPADILKAFTDKYPTAVIKGQQKQIREKIAFYEIESVDSGKTRDVLFQSDAVIVEVAESVSEDKLPENIQKALKEKYPDAKISGAESVTRGEHVEYEISLRTGKRTTEVVANLAGKIFTVK